MRTRVLWEESQGKAAALQTHQRVEGDIDRSAVTSARAGDELFVVHISPSLRGGTDSLREQWEVTS